MLPGTWFSKHLTEVRIDDILLIIVSVHLSFTIVQVLNVVFSPTVGFEKEKFGVRLGCLDINYPRLLSNS